MYFLHIKVVRSYILHSGVHEYIMWCLGHTKLIPRFSSPPGIFLRPDIIIFYIIYIKYKSTARQNFWKFNIVLYFILQNLITFCAFPLLNIVIYNFHVHICRELYEYSEHWISFSFVHITNCPTTINTGAGLHDP